VVPVWVEAVAAVIKIKTMKQIKMKSLHQFPASKIAQAIGQTIGQTGALALMATVNLISASPALAEAAPTSTQISFKTLSYRDYQSGEDRIDIDALAAQVDIPIAGQWSVSASAVTDAISGASPKYHSSALTSLEDDRDAYSLSVSRYFTQASVTLGTAYSKERDYESRSYSLQNTFSTRNQNTTLTTGLGYTSDRILPNSIFLRNTEHKKVLDMAVGLTQVLSQTDIAQATYRHARGRGYYADQYKLYDARPDTRDSDSLLLRWNHYFSESDTALRTSYRYYRDSFDIRSFTLDMEYVFNLKNDWQITPLLRYYSQSAASFYHDPVENDPWSDADTVGAPISVVYPLFINGDATSMDQRLSEFGALTWGFTVEKSLGRNWTADFKFEKYGQRADWSVHTGSPGLDDFSARSIQFGLRYSF